MANGAEVELLGGALDGATVHWLTHWTRAEWFTAREVQATVRDQPPTLRAVHVAPEIAQDFPCGLYERTRASGDRLAHFRRSSREEV